MLAERGPGLTAGSDAWVELLRLLLGMASTLLVFLAARRLADHTAWQRHERLLILAGIFWALVVTLQLIAGTLLRLTPSWVFLLSALAAGAAFVARPPARGTAGEGTAGPGTGPGGFHARLLVRILVTALALQSALVLWTAAILPPQGWDEWWYHLPPIARWVEQEKIDLMPVAEEWHDPARITALDDYQRRYRMSVTGFWSNVYPFNVETMAMWSLLFLHSDRWVDAAQLPLVLVGALAVYGLARWAGIRAPGPALAAVLWTLLPINQMQARTAYTDTALAAAILATLLFFLRWAETRSWPHFLAFSLYAGLALGSKPPALAYVGILGVLSLALVASRVRRQAGAESGTGTSGRRRTTGPWLGEALRQAAGHGLVLASVAIAAGGFWYLRTWAAYGSPVYPFSVRVLGHTLFAGLGSVGSLIYVANTPQEYLNTGFLSNMVRSWFEASRESYSFYTRTGGFGAIWAVLGVPAVALFAVRAIQKRDLRAATLLGLGALMVVLHSGSWWPRYSILVPGIGLVATGWLLAEGLQHRLLRTQLTVLVLVVTAWSLLRADLSLAQALPRALALPPAQRTIGRLYLADYAPVDALVPAGAQLGYAPMTFIYPLFGPDLQRRVVQVDGATPAEWLDNIRRTGVSYVSVLKRYGPHYAWARQSGGLLEEIETEGEVGLFVVR